MIIIEGRPQELKKPCVLYDNLLTKASVVYNRSAAEGPNSIDGNTYDSWTPESLTALMTCTFDEPVTVDCFCMTAHTLATSGAVLTVQYWDGASYQTVTTVNPEENDNIMSIWVPVSSEKWRIRITGSTPPSLGVLFLGKRLVFSRGIVGDYVPTNWAQTIEVLGGETLGGHFLPQRIQRRGGDTSISFGSFDREWFEGSAVEFVRHYNEAKPFFFAGGPKTVPNDLAYCHRGEAQRQIQPKLTQGGQQVQLSMGVSFYVPT